MPEIKFIKAKEIYPANLLNEMNISLFFVNELELNDGSILKITGFNKYRVFDNGQLLGYGPARAAKGYARVDEYKIESTGVHRIVVELMSYNCHSYCELIDRPFLQAEVIYNDEVITYTGDNLWRCYKNITKYQKTLRYSVKRNFMESYKFDDDLYSYIKDHGQQILFEDLKCDIYEDHKYLPRRVSYPTFEKLELIPVEEGTFYYDDSIQTDETKEYLENEKIGIFKKEELEIDPVNIISKYRYNKENIKDLHRNCFQTFKLNTTKTGFIEFEISAETDSEVVFVFDEIDSRKDGDLINLKFNRNKINNVITYKLEGKKIYHHMCFEPYTLKYLRVLVIKGMISINKLKFVLYENPDCYNMKFSFQNKKIQVIAEAALSTLSQNSVDLLTDCPSRERAGWLMDSYFTAIAEHLVTRSNNAEANLLENYALSTSYPGIPEDMIPMCYPSSIEDGTFSPNCALFYIIEIRQYYKRTMDQKISEMSVPNIKKLLEYFKKFENELGLLENLENWVFIEYSGANDHEFTKGVNIPTNILYAYALEAAGQVLQNPNLIKKARNMEHIIDKLAFNGKFYVDNLVRDSSNNLVQTNNISETCQYYAFFFKVATKKTRKELYKLLFKTFGPKRDYTRTCPNIIKSNVVIGDIMRLFILLRDGELARLKDEIINYFYDMASKTGTLWEFDVPNGSLVQGLTSSILNVIVNAYFGVKRINHITKEVVVSPKVVRSNCQVDIKLKDGQTFRIINKNGAYIIHAPSEYTLTNL